MPIPDLHDQPGGREIENKDGPHMELLASWTRSTVANIERSLSRADMYFDRILVGVLGLLAVAVVFLFVR
jgi:hypothetical protein